MKSKITLTIIIVVTFILGFYTLSQKIWNKFGTDDDIFKDITVKYYNDSINGVVTKKYIDWSQHGYKKIVIVNKVNQTKEFRLDYEWYGLFTFIEPGDSIFKYKKSLDMRLARGKIDTIIRLNFSSLKNSDYYIDYLYQLDSIYDK
ncbi:hypothetical protein SAMN04487891_103172 [Flagellimonas taeanensis]|uniref:Uncharacterized protein n=1 Tax=Flagellimonas taeanensis TaxID=1005926 RepID=A0A1M6TDQ5_9FLAO|nr:hypothetical protein [Allomuricauda taeanensis]SFB87525.1 hypothetical protein SAMN04487891_103172 [Allomuricauda taeanensis]SHK55127.1 hypothetical protein SAMN05216293_1334 [Allomuricauda taeanensis]